jgi:hypothetical protein
MPSAAQPHLLLGKTGIGKEFEIEGYPILYGTDRLLVIAFMQIIQKS